jgi:predicted O-methyltransferase YrrM
MPARPTIAGIPTEWTRGQFLAHLVDRRGWTQGVEIGVSYGDTLRHILAACSALHMIGVDTWAANRGAPEPDDWTQAHHDRAFASAETIERTYPGRCVLMRGRSAEIGPLIDPGSLDFVWIDGDHGTDACTADIAAWLPALKPGGWLLGHDINWPTVRVAVDAAVPGYLIGPDSVWFRPLHPVPGWWVA